MTRDKKENGTVFLDAFVQALDKYDAQLDEDELMALVQVMSPPPPPLSLF